MKLNPSSGNMYEFITHTGNTIKGICPHGCSYCYMKRWKNQRPVRLDESEFKIPTGSGNFIFVGSSCDMFADDIPGEWIARTLEHCQEYPDNRYLFQSKNPRRFLDFTFPAGTVFCTTIETNRWYPGIMQNAPHPLARVGAMVLVPGVRYVTIEPILEFDLEQLVGMLQLIKPEQVNIGADSGNNHLPEPSIDKVLELARRLGEFTTIHQKRNLGRLLKI